MFAKPDSPRLLTAIILTVLAACPVIEDEPPPPTLEGCELEGCPLAPATECVDASTLRTYFSTEGQCVDSVCVYDSGDYPCDCRDAACQELPAVGEQRTAVILVDAAGDGTAQPATEIREAMFDGERSVGRFIEEASYGRAWLSGEVYGWYPLATSDDLCLMSDAELLALASGEVPFADIDRFVILLHAPDLVCDGLGSSSHGKVAVDTPAGAVQASVSRTEISYRLARPTLPNVQLANIAATIVAHELGHGLGVRGHGNLLECGAATLSTSAADCEQEALADMFSIMGGEGFYRSALHFSACHKRDLGWLADHEVRTVALDALAPGDVVTARLSPYAQATGQGSLALRILLPTPIDIPTVVPSMSVTVTELYIENRTPLGFDAWLEVMAAYPVQTYAMLTRLDGAGEPSVDIVGAQIRGGFYERDHCVTTYLLDAHPGSLGYDGEAYNLYDSLDSTLNLGETMYEPNNGIAITTTGVFEDGSIEVEVRVEAS